MMERQLNTEDNADAMNSRLQVDVNANRDNNGDIKRNITDADMSRTEAIQQLRALQADRDRRTNMCHEIQSDLERKMQLCVQLEDEQYRAKARIGDCEGEIGVLNRQLLQDNAQIEDIQRVVERLTDERNELQHKLESLNRTYDNCVTEITREKSQMEGHNRHHNKLLVAKVTFTLLERMFVSRKQQAMNEFFQYCKFDTKCHNTLK